MLGKAVELTVSDRQFERVVAAVDWCFVELPLEV